MNRAERPKRLNLEVVGQAGEHLDSLKSDTGATSFAEVIRRALSLYRLIVDMRRDGGRLIVRKPDGTETEVVFL